MSLLSFPNALLLGPGMVGAKAWRLTKLHASGFPVLPGYCIELGTFREALAEAGRLREFETICSSLAANRGFGMLDRFEHIRQLLRDLPFPAKLMPELRQVATELKTFSNADALIVRSSGVNEDGYQRSHAGVYQSISDVHTIEELTDAIRQCWISAFQPRVGIYRQARGLSIIDPGICVLIQPMIHTNFSGVIFTCDPLSMDAESLWVSASATGGAVVDGTATPLEGRLSRTGVVDLPGLPAPLLTELRTLSLQVETLMSEGPQDIEWGATHGQLFIFQVRPVTTRKSSEAEAVLRIVSVDETEAIRELELGPVDFLYRNWQKKRIAMRSLVARTGEVANPTCRILRFNRLGLDRTNELVTQLGMATENVIVEISETMRGLVVPLSELHHYLEGLVDGDTATTVMIRDFYPGLSSVTSALSCQTEDGTVVVEYAAGSIVGLKSGMSSVSRASLSPAGTWEQQEQLQTDAVLFNCETRNHEHVVGEFLTKPSEYSFGAIQRFTEEANKVFLNPRLEWWIQENLVVLLDWSWEDTQESVGSGRVLSPGSVAGWAMVLPEVDEELLYLSDGNAVSVREIDHSLHELEVVRLLQRLIDDLPPGPVILVAPRPITAFALFMHGRIGGMIFEGGPTLCHLGILLREHRLPAVFLPSAQQHIRTGQWVELGPAENVTVTAAASVK